MKLLRFKDNTYVWLKADNTVNSIVLSEKNALAFGSWQLKIPRSEVSMGINVLKLTSGYKSKDNIAIYSEDQKMFLYTAKHGD